MEYFVVFALICVALVGELAQAGPSSLHEWMLFKREHGKSYESPAEDARRFAIFMATRERVERHNAKSDSSFKMGLNHLADWTQEERAKLNGVRVDESAFIRAQEKLNETEAYLEQILGSSSEPVPDELDWRTVPGRVSSVKDQFNCGSCWAFATVGVLEGQEMGRVFNGTGQVVSLSAQELVDCALSSFGCAGGLLALAFDDIQELGGIMSDKDYPYTGEDGKCTFNRKKVVIGDAGHVTLPPKDETKLKQVLAKFGPISIVVHTSDQFNEYKSGVLDDNECYSSKSLANHGVLLVGYGTDPKHGDYWIVKNSYGANWGDQGYIKIKRGVNMCGVANMPTIPKF